MKRWPSPRFGLGTLLLLTALASVVMGVWSSVVKPYREQAAAVARLKQAGATVRIQQAPGSGWRRSLVRWMAGPKAWVEVSGVTLERATLPKRFDQDLGALPFLVELRLDHTDFDDADARGLRGKEHLRILSIRYTRLTDAGVLDSLAGCRSLRHLRLTGLGGVTDEGLLALADLPRLEEIFARWTGATPAAVEAYASTSGSGRLHSDLSCP